MPYLSPFVECREHDCLASKTRVRLPIANPPEILDDQLPKPTDTWRVAIACRECGRVFEYTAEDYRWHFFDTPAPNRENSDLGCYAIEFRCAQLGCGIPTGFVVVVDADTEIANIESAAIAGRFRGPCQSGHPFVIARCEVKKVRSIFG